MSDRDRIASAIGVDCQESMFVADEIGRLGSLLIDDNGSCKNSEFFSRPVLIPGLAIDQLALVRLSDRIALLQSLLSTSSDRSAVVDCLRDLAGCSIALLSIYRSGVCDKATSDSEEWAGVISDCRFCGSEPACVKSNYEHGFLYVVSCGRCVSRGVVGTGESKGEAYEQWNMQCRNYIESSATEVPFEEF